MLAQIVEAKNDNALSFNGLKRCSSEEPIYPAEFLSVMKDTGFETLQECLKKTDAPKEALQLLEDLFILSTIGNIRDDERVSSIINQILVDTVASASRNITKVGGIFYGPSGKMISGVGFADPDQG